MNKGSRVRFIGDSKDYSFVKHRIYTVTAGQFDGVPRNDGTLGAYIQNDHQFTVNDEHHNSRLQSMNSGDWICVHEEASQYSQKREYKSPIQLTTSLC